MSKKGNDLLYFTDEAAFKERLPKLDQLVYEEGLRLGVDFNDFQFINCEGIFDIVDVRYSNGVDDFDVSVKGGERFGYKLLNSSISEALLDDELDDWED